MEGPEFLKKKYEMQTAPEVEKAVERKEKRSRLREAPASQAGEKVSQKPAERIQVYLDRFKEITERKDPHEKERGIEALKTILHKKFAIKPEEIPESYWEAQRRIMRERGQAAEYEALSEAQKQELRRQTTEVVVTDQQSSLDNWIDYLASPDATYPDWLKYWTIRSVLGMGSYDKGKKSFSKRAEGTVAPFPDINREALAYVLDAVSQKYGKRHIELLALNEEERKEFEKLLEGENFSKLYAWALEKTAVGPTEALAKTAGKWVKYPKNSDPTSLVESLRGHGTGWCTAGESTAQIQLKGGDFYVYYSLDEKGKPIIPRAAIRMQENQIAEVRGIAEQQNLDPYIGDVVQKKLQEFPDGPKYEKKANDMKMLTEIEKKSAKHDQLTKGQLEFLYEMNSKIEWFGYQKDPRIEELRQQRNPEEDMLTIFEATKDQIAHNPKEINENSKAYIGSLQPGIFDKIQEFNIEHIYTSFPEGRIRKETIEIGGKTEKELEKELQDKKINISDYAKDMMRNKDFTTLKNPEKTDLVRLKVKDLFQDSEYHTTDEVYQRAQELGLELCPAEVGPNYRLEYKDQPLNEWIYIAMKQIAGRDGNPRVFELVRREDGLWLYGHWASPTFEWNPGDGVVLRLRKLKS